MKGLNRESVKIFCYRYFEVIIWTSALLLLALMSPVDGHSSLCPFKALGIPFCPGCGLGHSISWLLHGEPIASFHAHPLGWFAVLILLYRIVTLIRKPIV